MRTLLILLLLSICISGQEECAYRPESLCSDETCGLPLQDPTTSVSCVCTKANIGTSFSPCNSDDTRSLTYFWKPPAVCIGGVDLNTPVTGIPCALRCGPGTFLNVTNSLNSCETCEAGTYSPGGGHIWNDWSAWPGQFFTNCAKYVTNSKVCSPWRLLGDSIDSGDNHLLDAVTSNLDLRVKLHDPGWIAFTYSVSAENGYDYLQFFVDDTVRLRMSNAATQYNTTLTAGYHTIRWQYYKDTSITRGLDKVIIQNITISGVTYAQTECFECPLGYYSNSSAAACIPCPSGFYSDKLGSSICTPCPSGYTSPPGASICTTTEPCSTAPDSLDVTFSYSPCVDGSRTKSWYLIEPAICDRTNLTLPNSIVESCSVENCAPGQVSINGICQYCQTGSVSMDGTACLACTEVGTGANQKIQTVDTFVGNWPAGFTSGCTGDCSRSRWRLASNYTDSGLDQKPGSDVWLVWNGTVTRNSRVLFTYSAPCNSESNFLFYINDTLSDSFACENTCDATPKTVNETIPQFWGNSSFVTLRWSYQQQIANNFTCKFSRAIISNIRIVGAVDNAGSTACVDCEPGYFSENSVCVACGEGTSSSAKSNSCSPCSGQSFKDSEPPLTCTECGTNTVANADHTKCVFNCANITFDNGRTYSLNQIPSIKESFSANNNFTLSVNISVCDYDPSCFSNAFVCMRTDDADGDGSFGTGKILSITESTTNQKGVQLSWKGMRNNDVSLKIECDPTSSDFKLNLDSSSISPNGNPSDAKFSLSSIYGCPHCMDIDFKYETTKCNLDANQGLWIRRRTYYQVNPYCFGGKTVPAAESDVCECYSNNPCSPLVSCSQDFKGNITCGPCPKNYNGNGTVCEPICNPTCENGGKCVGPNICDCTDTGFVGMACAEVAGNTGVSGKVVGALVAVGILVLAVAIGFAVVLYLRNRRLYAEYSKLAGGGGVSMDDTDNAL